MRTSLLIAVPVISFLMFGCPADDDDDTASSVCEPGATQLCFCAGGAEGAQVCEEDGSGWGICDCGSGDDDDVGDDDDIGDDDAGDDDVGDDDDSAGDDDDTGDDDDSAGDDDDSAGDDDTAGDDDSASPSSICNYSRLCGYYCWEECQDALGCGWALCDDGGCWQQASATCTDLANWGINCLDCQEVVPFSGFVP